MASVTELAYTIAAVKKTDFSPNFPVIQEKKNNNNKKIEQMQLDGMAEHSWNHDIVIQAHILNVKHHNHLHLQ